MSSLSMTSMTRVPLDRRGERDQRDVARLLDRFRQPPLVGRAHARNAARRDLSPLAQERAQQPHVLVVDIVDSVDTKPAHFLAPEILLLARDRLVAAGGPLRSADGSSASG